MKPNENNNMEETILETAERLFLEKGFKLTSTTEIAKEAGCNQALVHYYFRTKDKLFTAIFEHKIKTFASVFYKSEYTGLPFKEKIKKVVGDHFDILRANPKIPFFFINELTTNPERLEKMKNIIAEHPLNVLKQLADELNIEAKKGNIRPVNALDFTLNILSLNAMLFILNPIIRSIGRIPDEEFEKLLDRKKEENILMILKSLEK